MGYEPVECLTSRACAVRSGYRYGIGAVAIRCRADGSGDNTRGTVNAKAGRQAAGAVSQGVSVAVHRVHGQRDGIAVGVVLVRRGSELDMLLDGPRETLAG